jgi:glycosyltransferase involved in cell wall biosynthesis
VAAPHCNGRQPSDPGVAILGLADQFGVGALQTLGEALDRDRPDHLLVQYVPHAFGWKAMNLPFCLWLFRRRRRFPIWVMFHEVAFPSRKGQPRRYNFLAAVNRVMAGLVVRSARRIFVSTASWEPLLRKYTREGQPITWLPVPSTIPMVADPTAVGVVGRRYGLDKSLVIGHFGTYGPEIAGKLAVSLRMLLEADGNAACLLLGDGSERFRIGLAAKYPHLCGRIYAPGRLPDRDLSNHIAVCDLMLQPYPDGISTRRTTAMAALAHGRALVTNEGSLTEAVWRESSGPILAPGPEPELLVQRAMPALKDHVLRRRAGQEGKELYWRRFSIACTIRGLRRS